LESYTGVYAGSNTACGAGGATPSAISSFFGSDTTGFGLISQGNGITSCGMSGAVTDMTSAAGPLTNNYSLTGAGFANSPGASFNGSSSVTTNYGSISVATQGQMTGVQGYEGYAETVAFGIASDTLDVAGVGTSTGYMAFDFSLNGTFMVTNPTNNGSMIAQVEVQAGNAGNNPEEIFYASLPGVGASATGIENVSGTLYAGQPVPGCTTTPGSSTVSTNVTCVNGALQTYQVPVTFADVPLSFGLIANADPAASQTVSADPPSMGLTGIQVYNSSDQLISSYTITSDSGSSYGADGYESTAPEPATLWLAGCALIGLGWTKRRGRRPSASV
jgi:hypothetical protein